MCLSFLISPIFVLNKIEINRVNGVINRKIDIAFGANKEETVYILDSPKYFFVSRKLAEKFPQLLVSSLVLNYHTCMPAEPLDLKRKFASFAWSKYNLCSLVYWREFSITIVTMSFIQYVGAVSPFFQRMFIRSLEPLFATGFMFLVYEIVVEPLYLLTMIPVSFYFIYRVFGFNNRNTSTDIENQIPTIKLVDFPEVSEWDDRSNDRDVAIINKKNDNCRAAVPTVSTTHQSIATKAVTPTLSVLRPEPEWMSNDWVSTSQIIPNERMKKELISCVADGALINNSKEDNVGVESERTHASCLKAHVMSSHENSSAVNDTSNHSFWSITSDDSDLNNMDDDLTMSDDAAFANLKRISCHHDSNDSVHGENSSAVNDTSNHSFWSISSDDSDLNNMDDDLTMSDDAVFANLKRISCHHDSNDSVHGPHHADDYSATSHQRTDTREPEYASKAGQETGSFDKFYESF